MLKGKETIVPGWVRNGSAYIYPPSLVNTDFTPWGFDKRCEGALDMWGWAGFDCLLEVPADGMVTFTAEFVSSHMGHTDHSGADSLVAEVDLTAGQRRIFLSLTDFHQQEIKSNVWRFLKGIRVEGAEVIAMSAMRARSLAIDCSVRGKSAAPGEEVCYQAEVTNVLDHAVMVQARQRCIGWESMFAVIEPAVFRLESGETRSVTIRQKVLKTMPAGGHEETQIFFTADGDSASQSVLSLYTMSALTHPCIYHDRKGWQEAGRRGRELPQFRQSYENYIRDASDYIVEPPEQDKPYCYPTQVEHQLMSCAYAYAMTGEIVYAQKVADFFRHFVPAYLERQRGCSQSYVQEGHFFQHLAIPYDIIHDSGVLTAKDHADIEAAFRLYMEILDQHLCSGHTSNWLLSEITGALYCAFALQDCERILRFAMGNGGTYQQLSRGLFNDGWWYECSVSYNTWVSSMMLHTARALRLIGIDWVNMAFPVNYSRFNDASWMGQAEPLRFDMDNERRGGNRRNCIYIKDVFDAPLKYLDERGVIFGICDSNERRLEGVHFGSTYELAYHYYQDPRYIPVIRGMTLQDCVFGVEDLPEANASPVTQNACSDNIGIAMLRSNAPDRQPLQQIQAVLRYGSHGYAHGHFDRASLLSVMRYGRSFFNPECIWWGYPHFMYKFYVQNSMTKNMVVVDEKHQNVSDSSLCLFATGRHVQAACVETAPTWSYPPFGGMVYDVAEGLEGRCNYVGCTLRVPEDAPGYGEVTGYTEPIHTRRLMAVTGDYIVLFDYLRGEQSHRFSNLFQIKGFEGLKGAVAPVGHTRRFSDDLKGDAQFVTDCHHYDADGTTCASFCTVFGEDEDLRGTRAEHNEPGLLKMDVHAAWPRQNHQVMGLIAEDHLQYIPVRYQILADGRTAAQGEVRTWLGCVETIACDVSGASSLTLNLRCLPLVTEQLDPYDCPQGLFLGDAVLTLRDGSSVRLCDLPMQRVNVDEGCGVGRDYENGRVLLLGKEMPDAIPVSPIDHSQDAVLTIDLTGLDAVSFRAELGADAFPGDEQQRRRTYAIQTEGVSARFVTVVEPFEDQAMVASVEALDADTVRVKLRDGRVETISVTGMEDGSPAVHFACGNETEHLTGVE